MSRAATDVAVAPITVAWEVTRACPLRCLHCRAEAIPRRDPGELDTDEGRKLIDEVAALGTRVLVFTGGDPLARPDLFALITHASEQGLHVGLSPSVTGRLTLRKLRAARASGVSSVHLSLDGASAATHDSFRGVPGSFDRTLDAMANVRSLGLPLQVGTSVTRRTFTDLPLIADLLEGLATMWSLFFLVPTGRARASDMLDADEHEDVLGWLARTAERVPFGVRTTAAPAYRRVRTQQGLAAPPAASANDGKGFCFISHTGEVHPSGFLPLTVGNVRAFTLAELYRGSPLFRSLRDPEQLRGKCGHCEFRSACGGSRARAYALTGDPLAADPTCAYMPDPAQPRAAMTTGR
jgi:AdoMet-dependent heme synthase